MGGPGSGRPPGADALIRQQYEKKTPIVDAEDSMFLPNYSGDHSAGIVRETPTEGIDLVNKKYVDDLVASVELVTITVFNNTGGILPACAPVYMTGWNVGQGAFQVALADADNASAMPAIGLCQTAIAIAGTGTIIMSGELHGCNTNSWNQDDELWVHTTAGELTSTKPTGLTTAIQKVAQVSRKHISSGVLLVFGAGRINDVPNQLTRVLKTTADQSSADTEYFANILYNTDATPPAASGFPVGTIYIQYTA